MSNSKYILRFFFFSFWGPANANFLKQYCYILQNKFENIDVMYMHIVCSVYRCLLFLLKVTLPTTGLAYIIKHFYSFSWIRVNGDHFVNVAMLQNAKEKQFSF